MFVAKQQSSQKNVRHSSACSSDIYAGPRIQLERALIDKAMNIVIMSSRITRAG